ncbi:MAG TPA: hypothetical protein VMW75_02180 [Thermoanaerobaculia bacterium]|nr:hypothetical protein [Thermoanaerobaculia bacterium]
MKFKRLEKMTLSRETLRRLESEDMRRVAGGVSRYTLCTQDFTNCAITHCTE